MVAEENADARAARAAAPDAIPALVASASGDALRSLIDNPEFDETHVIERVF